MSRNVALLIGGVVAAEATGVTNFSGEDGEVGVPQIPGLPDMPDMPDIRLPDIAAPNVELSGLGRQVTDGVEQAGQQFTDNAGQQLGQPFNNPLNTPVLGVPPTEPETTAGDSWLQQGANRFGQEIGGVPMSIYGGAIDVGVSSAEDTKAWIGRNNPLNESGEPQRIRDVGSDVVGYDGWADNPIDEAFEDAGLGSGFLQDLERPTVSGDVSNPLESLSTSGDSSGGSSSSGGSGSSGGSSSSVSIPTASDMQSSASESVSSTVSSASESASSTVSSASESASSTVSSASESVSSTVSSASESVSSTVSSASDTVSGARERLGL